MPLDPDCIKVHELYAKAKRPPLEQLSPDEARDASRRGRALLCPDAPDVGAIEMIDVPGPAGKIPVRVYRPKSAPDGDTGALVYYHGGGWVIGDLDSHDVLCRELCNGSGHSVFSIDYRLAPEHPFPAAIDDAIAATKHIAANAKALKIDASRLAVGGDSAGGNLAAAVSLALKGATPHPIKLQLLIYPAVDATMSFDSVKRHGDVLPLTKPAMEWFWAHYGSGKNVTRDWRAAPLAAESLAGLPAAHVIIAECDVLCDEGIAYAQKLMMAGVPVSMQFYPGMIHGFITMGKIVRTANTATADAAAALKKALA